MSWPPDELWSRIAAVWRHAHGAPGANVGEQANAFAALRQFQLDFDLSDVEVAYISEYQTLDPSSRAIRRERTPNAFEVVLDAVDGVGLVMPFEHIAAATAWALHTYVFSQFLHTPRLLVYSRGSGYGKTALLSCINELANHSKYAIAPSAPALYRWLRKHPDSTFVIDNAEHSSLWDPQNLLRQVYEAGHRQGAEIPRVIRDEVIYFPTFASLALGTVLDRYRRDKFPQQIMTRSIALELKKSHEGWDQIFPGDPRFAPVRAVASGWAGDFKRPKTISLPKELPARCGDNWRVLAAVADSLGYGATLRAAAIAIERASFDPEIGLYENIYKLFERQQAGGLWTSEIVQALSEVEGGPWGSLTNEMLYDLFWRRGIEKKTVWKTSVDGTRRSNKGFYPQQFEQVWRELLGYTGTQASKIIRLPRHKSDTGEAQ
jgi:hypothetical protein